MIVSRNSFFLLILVALAAGFSAVLPVVAMCVLVLGVPILMFTTRSYSEPGFLLGLALPLYLLVGGLNLSVYRGDIEPEFFSFMALSILALLAGTAVGSLGAPRLSAPSMTEDASLLLVLLCAVPGLAGTAMMLAQTGVPLLNPALRYAVSPQALLLIETFFVPITLLGARVMHQSEKTGWLKVVLLMLFVLLLLPGYRGWLVGGLFVLTMMTLSQGVTMRKLVLAMVGMGGVLAIFVVLALVRRSTQAELFDPAASLRMFDAEGLPQWFAQIHFAVRESLALGQWLWSERNNGGAGESLLFADMTTLLPGQQQAAGEILGDIYKKHALAGGLTAVLPATLFYEYGRASFAVLAGVGVMMGLWWTRICRQPHLLSLGLYSLSLFYLLHFFHRGLMKPAYIVVPLLLFCAIQLPRLLRTSS